MLLQCCEFSLGDERGSFWCVHGGSPFKVLGVCYKCGRWALTRIAATLNHNQRTSSTICARTCKNYKGAKMLKKQAYDFFLMALKDKLIVVLRQLDTTSVDSSLYDTLTDEQMRLQHLLAALDDIANAV
jgi:hypothetical protein